MGAVGYRYAGGRIRARRTGTIRNVRLAMGVILTGMVAAGCADRSPASEPVVETLPSGVRRVSYARLPERAMTVAEIARWDLWGETGEYLFNSPIDVAGGPTSFFLLDTGNRQVVELSPAGDVRRVFGREGSGPGELRSPLHLARTGDRLWISDVGNRRFSIYGLDGAYIDDTPWPGASRLVGTFRVTSTGDILHGGQWPLTRAQLAEQDPLFYLALFPGPGRWEQGAPVHLDTVATMHGARWIEYTIRSREGAERYWGGAPIFSPRFHWAADEETIVTVTGAGYRFEVRDVSGRIRLEVVGPDEPIPVTEAWRRFYFDVIAPRELGRTEPFTLTSDSRARFEFADRVPALEGIALDPQGRIWIAVTAAEAGGYDLDLFGPEGGYRGRIAGQGLPAAFTGDGHVLFRQVQADGNDLWWVGLVGN